MERRRLPASISSRCCEILSRIGSPNFYSAMAGGRPRVLPLRGLTFIQEGDDSTCGAEWKPSVSSCAGQQGIQLKATRGLKGGRSLCEIADQRQVSPSGPVN